MEEYSWHQLKQGKLIKNLDFSSFNHRTSVIPKEFYDFFDLDSESKDKVKINLVNKDGKSFKSYIRHADKSRTTPAKLIVWDKSLDKYLKSTFPQWANINKGEKTQDYKLTFIKTKNTNEYIISTEINQLFRSEYLFEFENQGCDLGFANTYSLPLNQSPRLLDLATIK